MHLFRPPAFDRSTPKWYCTLCAHAKICSLLTVAVDAMVLDLRGRLLRQRALPVCTLPDWRAGARSCWCFVRLAPLARSGVVSPDLTQNLQSDIQKRIRVLMESIDVP